MANTNPRRVPLAERQPDKALLRAVDAYNAARFRSPRDVPRALERVRKLCTEQGFDMNEVLHGFKEITSAEYKRAQERAWEAERLAERQAELQAGKGEPSLDEDGVEVGTSEEFHAVQTSLKLLEAQKKERTLLLRQARIASHRTNGGA